MEQSEFHVLFFFFLSSVFSLKLISTVILYAKTHPKKEKLLFCELTNEYTNSANYETIRLACVLARKDQILWKHLIFSNAMIFLRKAVSYIFID